MENPAFISVDDIRNTYMPMGFSNFKIEGRGLGSALVLEFLLYYMIKPEYQIHVREDIYLDAADMIVDTQKMSFEQMYTAIIKNMED